MDRPGEQYSIRYNDDHALVTISLRLEYNQARLEADETPPLEPVFQEFLRLKAAMERYVSRTHGLDISNSGQWLKPRQYEVPMNDRQSSTQRAALPSLAPMLQAFATANSAHDVASAVSNSSCASEQSVSRRA